jgi:hypothetical protein
MASPPTSPKPKRPTRLPPSPLNPDVLLPETQAALEQGQGQGHGDTLGVGLGRPALSPPAASADGRRKSSAARDLLRKHYGLGAGPSTRLGSHPADPMDLGERCSMTSLYVIRFDASSTTRIFVHVQMN